MDFHADDDFPVTGSAGDQALGVGRTGVDDGHSGLLKQKNKTDRLANFNSR
jgi:hypothetical protein